MDKPIIKVKVKTKDGQEIELPTFLDETGALNVDFNGVNVEDLI